MKLFMGVQLIKMASVVASHTCAEVKKGNKVKGQTGFNCSFNFQLYK